jgi:arylamine N-acetyltransferase
LNGALSELLRALGYHVTRHVGGVHGPGGPDAESLTNHLVLVVHDLPTDDNPAGDWYVDAGLGDGLYEPLPMVPGTYEQGPMRFVLARADDGIGDWHFTHDATGSFGGMSFRLPPVEMDAFSTRHRFLSTSPESSFAVVVTAQLRHERGTTILRGCVLTRRTDDVAHTETVDRRAEWFELLGDVFDIRPAAAEPALDALWSRVMDAHESWAASRHPSARPGDTEP